MKNISDAGRMQLHWNSKALSTVRPRADSTRPAVPSALREALIMHSGRSCSSEHNIFIEPQTPAARRKIAKSWPLMNMVPTKGTQTTPELVAHTASTEL